MTLTEFVAGFPVDSPKQTLPRRGYAVTVSATLVARTLVYVHDCSSRQQAEDTAVEYARNGRPISGALGQRRLEPPGRRLRARATPVTVSFEDRPITLSHQVAVYQCDNPGCSSEIDGGSADMTRTLRHPNEDECFRAHGWFELVTDPRTAGPIFCSWRCIASYGATASRIGPLRKEPSKQQA